MPLYNPSSGGNANINPDDLNPDYQILTWGTTTTWTCNSTQVAQNAELTLQGHTTLSLTNLKNGMNGNLVVIQNGVGGYAVTLPAGSKAANSGAGAIVVTPTAGAITILSWVRRNGVLYWTAGTNFT